MKLFKKMLNWSFEQIIESYNAMVEEVKESVNTWSGFLETVQTQLKNDDWYELQQSLSAIKIPVLGKVSIFILVVTCESSYSL